MSIDILRRMEKIQERYVKVDSEEIARKLFDELMEQRKHFGRVPGILTQFSEYQNAVRIYRKCEDLALTWNGEWNSAWHAEIKNHPY